MKATPRRWLVRSPVFPPEEKGLNEFLTYEDCRIHIADLRDLIGDEPPGTKLSIAVHERGYAVPRLYEVVYWHENSEEALRYLNLCRLYDKPETWTSTNFREMVAHFRAAIAKAEGR